MSSFNTNAAADFIDFLKILLDSTVDTKENRKIDRDLHVQEFRLLQKRQALGIVGKRDEPFVEEISKLEDAHNAASSPEIIRDLRRQMLITTHKHFCFFSHPDVIEQTLDEFDEFMKKRGPCNRPNCGYCSKK